MKKHILCFSILLSAFLSINAIASSAPDQTDPLDVFLQKEGIADKFYQNLEIYGHQKPDEISKIKKDLTILVQSNASQKYKQKYISDMADHLRYYAYIETELNPELAVRYSPHYAIDFLENKIKEHTVNALKAKEKFQLLVLWQVYKKSIINTPAYNEVADAAHNEVMNYLNNKNNWQASWRDKEYMSFIKDNPRACYNDLPCLLNIIPYWSDWGTIGDMEVVIPCDTAQKYHKVFYFDTAAGGHGSQTFLTSDCALYDKYNLPRGAAAYLGQMIDENMFWSDGSIRFVYMAQSMNYYHEARYDPDFKIEKQQNWLSFPYTEWAVQSYYNWKKFNAVLNDGVGYKTAVEELTTHYEKLFHVSHEVAFNKVLAIFNPPSSLYWKRIDKNNLNYLILSGAPWKQIQKRLSAKQDINSLFELAIAHPSILNNLINTARRKGKLNIDKPNDFGKTPLMTAAQYGFLESVKILIQNGATINRQTNEGECYSERDIFCMQTGKRTALMYALQEGQYETAKYLIEKGADLTLTDTQGKTVCHYLTQEAPLRNPQAFRGITEYISDEEKREPVFNEQQIKELSTLLLCKPEQ